MNPDRAIAAILTTSLLVVLALGIWLLRRDGSSETPAAPPTEIAAPPTVTAAPDTAAAVTPPPAARTHRLAGTVVGGVSFAIIEDDKGGNALYRPGQTVPGLGELIEVGENHVLIAGGDGRFEMRIAAAPTVTATPSRIVEPTPFSTRVRRSPAPSEYESSP